MSNEKDRNGEDDCYVAEKNACGRGVFAARALSAGRTALVFGGPLLARASIADFTHCIEIGDGLFLGPSHEANDFVNHSCSPNCRITIDASGVSLETLRPIRAHEELTYDYATTMVTDPTRFRCTCGSVSCRGQVSRFADLSPAIRTRLLEQSLVPDFVVHALHANGNTGPLTTEHSIQA